MSASQSNNRNGPGPEQGPQAISQHYKFSAEEMRAIRECNRESFYFRCLPFAATAMAVVHLAVRQGYIKPHPRWGSTFKMMGAGFMGWIIGKVSYQSKCEEKLMHLPNSKIGEMLRKRRGYSEELFSGGSQEASSDESLSVFSGTGPSQERGDLPGTMTLENYRDRSPKGLDDSQRPSLDSTFELPEEEEEVKKIPRATTTYEELRKKNRDEYESRISSSRQQQLQPPSASYGGSAGTRTYGGESSTSSPSQGIPAQSTGKSKNPYGDVWDT